MPLPAFADDQTATRYGWREISGGIDATRDQWLAYSTTTVAPWSRDIYSEGFRLRVGGGYGRYSYDRTVTSFACGSATTGDTCHSDVSRTYADVLAGYYMQLGELTAKAFAGAVMSSEHHLRQDPLRNSDGTEWGAKGVLELWLNAGPSAWTSLDVSYATARDQTSSRLRAGWRAAPAISLGPELRYDKNVETGTGAWNGRAGLFARYEWLGGEASLAAGAAWWVDGWDPKSPSPYGTLNILFQY